MNRNREGHDLFAAGWFVASYLGVGLTLILLSLLSCGTPTSPDFFDARILRVEARSCSVPQRSMDACIRESEAFEPLDEIPRGRFVWFVTTYQNPVEPAWENYSVFQEEELVGNFTGPLGTEDQATQTIVGDTVRLGVITPWTHTFTLQITLATGSDSRFLSLVADTSFTWSQQEPPPTPEEERQ